MHYHVSRNGQTYGPYTLEDLQRYVASGNILASDMAKTDEMTEWLPVSEILGAVTPVAAFATPGFANPGVQAQGYVDPAYGASGALAASQYPDAPNLHWGLVILFTFLSCGLFMPIWNIVVAAWLKRVQPNATALFYYIGVVVLFFVSFLVGLFVSSRMMMHPIRPGDHVGMAALGPMLIPRLLLYFVIWVVRLVARYSERASLEEHFNGPEPVGLRINPILTFFFGGVYFQYHLNKVNAMKQAARFGAPRY